MNFRNPNGDRRPRSTPARRVAIAMSCASLLVAATHAESAEPLDASEVQAVVREIEAMVKTKEDRVVDFVVRDATPDRIERLYRSPEVVHLPKTIRENGLIFAGRGSTLLHFAQPSDVVNAVASWFPEEIAAARARKDQRLWSGDIHLWGPFANWDAEPAAFMALWNCMPLAAIVRPEASPFARRLEDSLLQHPLGAQSSAYEEADFGHCVRHRNGHRAGMTAADNVANQAETARIAEAVTPLLRERFATFLSNRRCEGTGPEDCVLVLRMWASLLPADAGLAVAMQTLESRVAPDGPLPDMQKTSPNAHDFEFEDGRERFDAGLRRAAFLRAKLLSVTRAPAAWPADALATTLRQMTQLRQAFAVPYVRRWYVYEIDYRNDPLNPWLALPNDPATARRVREAILAELDRAGDDIECDVFRQWFDHGGKPLRSVYALRRMQRADRPASPCASPDHEWLRQDGDVEAAEVRDGYLGLLGRVAARDHDALLTGLTDGGARCFERRGAKTPGWLRRVCTTWIAEPQVPSARLRHAGPAWRVAKLKPLPAADDRRGAAQARWMADLVRTSAPEVRRRMREIAADFGTRDIRIHAAGQWVRRGSARSLIEFRLYMKGNTPDAGWPLVGARLLLDVGPRSITLVGVPARFAFQYDEGSVGRVTDLDRDGRFEVWLSGTFGECDGEDLQPGIDCASEVVHMGEIRGDTLTYFARKPRRVESR